MNGITDEEILANSFIFLVAGFETTANALSFAIDLLIKHPDVQERLYQEIAEARNDEYDTVQSKFSIVILTSRFEAKRGYYGTDLVILNRSQTKRTTPELASPPHISAPH
ncbi:hypothetical protein AVEN_257796-1 [Araneus ventricosus]|uniref:Uncharacterized protein n=1 Tax=Araneus ventricosus TaxID=182803 RepID=A0A4Y2KEK0_ARAVE|nr:hypothetical protein AVEN_257796-1 [Araneus ventricosus]